MKSLSEQASKISVFLVIAVTMSKFAAYFISESLTVYSEAWHGFSDLFTTLLIFIAIKISNKGNSKDKKLNKKAEIFVAVFIGLILSYISVSILYNVIFYTPVKINKPLETGIAFVFFSFTSYFLYKFQTKVGKLDNSVALTADGQHSRSDMITSLITGFSLILESKGINIDRYSAALLGTIIFIFAVELLFTTLKSIKGNENIYNNIFKINSLNKKILKTILIVSIPVILIYASTVSIPLGYKGLVLKFGKKYKILNPGKHFIIPIVEKVKIISSTRIKTVNIGNIAQGPLIWSKKHGKTITEMITGDNNFIVPYIKVEYNVKNVENYYYNYENIPKIISDICNSELTYFIITNGFEDILLKRSWVDELKKKIQKRLDKLKTGVNILALTIQDIHPPKNVSQAFENLIATLQDLQTLKTRAKSYAELKIMNATTESKTITTKAQIDYYKKITKIKAQTLKDENTAKIFKRYPDIAKIYLFLNMIEKTIVNNRKILTDPASNIELRFENKKEN